MRLEFMIVKERTIANEIESYESTMPIPSVNDNVILPEMDAGQNIGLTVERREFHYDQKMELDYVQVWCKRNPHVG